MPRRESPRSWFWIAISGAVWASITLLAIIPVELGYGLVLITLTTAAWAICFRAQLEFGRVSLVAIFALVTMLAVLFSAFRYFDPLGIYPG